ncbi:sugar phosphate nucleotidyltransferase [Burkholderia plantarii]|uniref:sugar phosphate nucleotidyltransferase n=1 Tax=Burkholderia plantarii TaxID=41899 RepID=UPI0006D8AE04|nr:sugar phosphate nucleotidyltransferase [Burkholderia plantarii]ALK30629.1 HAD superfamily hydrolase [Burkholderia plantarii]GLZ19676.1 nucleoside-diphosphate-sugar pyrophosphorylase [Burkholderia plantarii]
MKALILCGGLGTRLRSEIGVLQKAVADVNGHPFLYYVIEQLAQAGLKDLVFCTCYQAEQVEQFVASLPADPARRVAIVREPVAMGTGGGLIHAISTLRYEGAFIALNADTYLDAKAYRSAACAQPPSIVVTPVDDCGRYGAVQIDDTQRVIAVEEKGKIGPGLISAGVYGLHTRYLRAFPDAPLSMEEHIIPALISGQSLVATRYNGPFLDIGTPDSLKFIREHGVQKLQ